MDNAMRITYHWEGDYQIPDITVPQELTAPLGKYGRMRKRFIQEHRPILFNRLVMTGKLYGHLLEIDEAANSRIEQMVSGLAKANGATEALKTADQMAWTRLMNSLHHQAEEIVLAELVYT